MLAAQYNTVAVHVCKSHPVLFPMALRPNAGQGLPILKVHIDHTLLHNTVCRDALDE